MTAARQTLGKTGEDHAAEHFARLGYELVDRNVRTRFGEIDLIVADQDTLVICEVKSRRAGSGSPWDSLTAAKRLQVRRMAAHWLATRAADRRFFPGVRFDAIGVVLDRQGRLVSLEHHEGAF